jgi:multidrug efflux pump subunit AcrA (membrane-fusion protein)
MSMRCEVGQPVRLLFSALVTRNLPDITGTLSRVSADALTDSNTGVPFFLAEVTLSPEAIALFGDQQLLPGMPVEASSSHRQPQPDDLSRRTLHRLLPPRLPRS